jgi:hypothetical protein
LAGSIPVEKAAEAALGATEQAAATEARRATEYLVEFFTGPRQQPKS